MPTEPKERMRLGLLRDSIRRLLSGQHLDFAFNRVFQKAGCSCTPLRGELAVLEKECTRLEDELYHSEPFVRRGALRKEILEIDQREHGPLDRQSSLAFPFMRVWLFEQMTDTGEGFELTTPEAAAQAYAEAWLGGWRPKGQE